jgi:hypothetical protein
LAGIDRWGEVGQGAAEEARRLAQEGEAEARAAELARVLPHALDPANLGAVVKCPRPPSLAASRGQEAGFFLAVA